MIYLSGLIYIILSIAIAKYLGEERQIGSSYALLISLFLSPIIGFIATMTSSKHNDNTPSPSVFKKVWGWILIIWGPLVLLSVLISGTSLESIVGGIGLMILGFYLKQRGEGKRFDNEGIIKSEEHA